MARAEVVHSTDAVEVVFRGDRRRPEPSTAVIKFPGGHVEVSRCSDGTYGAHVCVVGSANVVGSRIEYAHGGSWAVGDLPEFPLVTALKVRVANAVAHFDPDA